MAHRRPIVLALGCCSAGSLEDIIDRNTILSIPKTISRKVNVSNAIHADGNKNVSKISIKEKFDSKIQVKIPTANIVIRDLFLH